MASPNKHSLLFVDDEPNILNAIRRQLSKPPIGRHAYHLEMFTNPELALERAKEHPFEVVISDYRMPQMDGATFLKAFEREQPDCTRMVMSGQADMAALAQLINEAQIFRFIAKPWSSDFLIKSIAQAIAFHLRAIRARKTLGIQPETWEFAQRERCLRTPEGTTIILTDTESTLMAALMRTDGKPASRKHLIEALGHNFLTYDERRLEVKLSRLRKKIRDLSGGHEPIRSEWGVGYIFISPFRSR